MLILNCVAEYVIAWVGKSPSVLTNRDQIRLYNSFIAHSAEKLPDAVRYGEGEYLKNMNLYV